MYTDKVENMTFDTFAVTEANRREYNLCLRAKSDCDAFRLLFIRLPAHERLHLKCAFESEFRCPEDFCTITSGDFTANLITELQTGQTTEETTRWEQVKVLLVDDLQHFAEKDETQKRFYRLLRYRMEAKLLTVLFSEVPAHLFSDELANLLKLGVHEAE